MDHGDLLIGQTGFDRDGGALAIVTHHCAYDQIIENINNGRFRLAMTFHNGCSSPLHVAQHLARMAGEIGYSDALYQLHDQPLSKTASLSRILHIVPLRRRVVTDREKAG
jgi:hypothetical protein